jgi:RAT1-interacting protein
MASSGRKRNLNELLDGEDTSQPPATRQRLDPEINRSLIRDDKSSSTHTNTPDSKFLAYPDLSNPKPVSVPFQQPSQLISFSYDASHVQEFSDSALRYFVQPRNGADLSYGYERWVKKPDGKGRVDALLKAISRYKKDGASKGVQFPQIGVVSWRGVMTKYVSEE